MPCLTEELREMAATALGRHISRRTVLRRQRNAVMRVYRPFREMA